MKKFSIKQSLKHGWEMIKKHFWLAAGVTLVYSIFNMHASYNDALPHADLGIAGAAALLFAGLAFWVLSIIVEIGYTNICLKLEKDEKPKFKELFTHVHPFWKFVGVNFLYFFIVLGGLILLIIPGIMWGIKYIFAPVLVVDRKLGPIKALKESGKMTDGHKWHLLKLVLVLGGVNILGLLCLAVGTLVTVPLTAIAFMHVYRRLS